MVSFATMAEFTNIALKRLYELWRSGDVEAITQAFPSGLTFEIKGQSVLAGKRDLSGFSRLLGSLKELSAGTFEHEIHDILSSDRHAMVLATCRLVRGGKPIEYRTVHVWRLESGLPIAGYEYLRDQYQFDQIWS
ncbi:MAG: nuclear transport factor 2 family protein [Oligoflexia bacterium]|jgi:hypothetical protein